MKRIGMFAQGIEDQRIVVRLSYIYGRSEGISRLGGDLILPLAGAEWLAPQQRDIRFEDVGNLKLNVGSGAFSRVAVRDVADTYRCWSIAEMLDCVASKHLSRHVSNRWGGPW